MTKNSTPTVGVTIRPTLRSRAAIGPRGCHPQLARDDHRDDNDGNVDEPGTDAAPSSGQFSTKVRDRFGGTASYTTAWWRVHQTGTCRTLVRYRRSRP